MTYPDARQDGHGDGLIVHVVTLHEFLNRDFPPRELMLTPFLPTQGAALVVAPRGVGKTHFSIGCAVAVATGTNFLKFAASQPRRVLFVDGEMPGAVMQARLAAAIRRLPDGVTMDPDYFRLITPDTQDGPMVDLATPEGRKAVEDQLQDTELLVLDNISCLFRSGPGENDEDSWRAAQEWILKLRRCGISVMILHHAGRNGKSRGTSKREDIVDAVVMLERPKDYDPAEGARFEVSFDKAREFRGDVATPFVVQLQDDCWVVQEADDAKLEQVRSLRTDGRSYRDIAKKTGVPKSVAHRMMKGGR